MKFSIRDFRTVSNRPILPCYNASMDIKYCLRVALLLFGIVALAGVALVWLPWVYVYHFSEFENLVVAVVSGAWVIFLIAFLLWVARQVWNEILRLQSLRKVQKRREAYYERIPSWGDPPPLPHATPAPNPPRE